MTKSTKRTNFEARYTSHSDDIEPTLKEMVSGISKTAPQNAVGVELVKIHVMVDVVWEVIP